MASIYSVLHRPETTDFEKKFCNFPVMQFHKEFTIPKSWQKYFGFPFIICISIIIWLVYITFEIQCTRGVFALHYNLQYSTLFHIIAWDKQVRICTWNKWELSLIPNCWKIINKKIIWSIFKYGKPKCCARANIEDALQVSKMASPFLPATYLFNYRCQKKFWKLWKYNITANDMNKMWKLT